MKDVVELYSWPSTRDAGSTQTTCETRMTLSLRRQASADVSPKTRKRFPLRTGAAIGLAAAVLLGGAQPAVAAEPSALFTAAFSSPTVNWPNPVQLNFALDNTGGAIAVTDAGFEVTLPDGLRAWPGSFSRDGDCIDATIILTQTKLTVSGLRVEPGSDCSITVPTSPQRGGDFTNQDILTSYTANVTDARAPSMVTVIPGQFTTAPSGLKAQHTGPGQVVIDWDDVTSTQGNGPVVRYVTELLQFNGGGYVSLGFDNSSVSEIGLDLQQGESYKLSVVAATDTANSPAAEIPFYVPADRSGLTVLIGQVAALVPADYTANSWAQVASELADANTAIDSELTQNQVDAAAYELQNAINGLVSIVQIRAAYEEFLTWNAADYTDSSWADAVSWASNVSVFLAAATDPSMPIDPNAALDGLNAFQQVKAGLMVDVTELMDYLDWFIRLDLSQFSAFSAAKLSAAMAAAHQLTTSEDPITAAQVKDAVDAIDAAIPSLLGISSLRTQVESYKGFDASGYTAASVAAFLTAWDAGKQMLNADETVEFTAEEMSAVITEMSMRHALLVSTHALTLSVETARDLVVKDFTEASWAVLADAVADGKAILARAADPVDPVTWEEVGAADDAVWEAINGLKLAPNDAKDDGLAEARTVISVNGEPISAGATLGIGSSLLFTGSGLLPGSKFRVELHSTPIVLGTAIVDAQGNVTLTVVIPSNAALGQHTLHVYSTAADGTEVDDATAIQIAGLTETGAAVTLPITGGELPLPLLGGAALLIAAGVWMITRRRMVEAAA